jgi:DNA-binding MltR family transcriptional regulator
LTLFGASIFDQSLKALISNYLLDRRPKQNLMGGGNAPLGTFSVRLSLTAALGLVTQDEYHNCLIMKGVRNLFAHELIFKLDFEHKKIRTRCQNLRFIIKNPSGSKIESSRWLFIAIFCSLLMAWHDRLNYSSATRPTVYQRRD